MADIALRAMYIRSIDNRVADHFSRIARPRDYSIRADVFYEVQKEWGSCTVDAFSSEATAMLPRFWAERAGGAAEAADAFAQEWRGERVWAHPPVGALPQLAQFLRERPALEALVCAPLWEGESWFGLLMELASERRDLPRGSCTRVSFDAPARLESWPMVVFRVSPRA